MKENIDYKIRWINVKVTTDPYGQCDFQQYLDSGDESTSVLSVHIDGGYAAFITSGNHGRIFNISALPFEFASNLTLNVYILYATNIYIYIKIYSSRSVLKNTSTIYFNTD